MKHSKIALTGLMLAVTCGVQAGTLIESIDENGLKGRISIEQNHARIDGKELVGYLLVQMNTGQVFAVNHQERVVLDLNTPPPVYPLAEGQTPEPPPPLPKVTMTLVGKGATVAGYATQHYRVRANGEHCFDELLAKKPLENQAIKKFIATVAAATNPQHPVVLGAPVTKIPACDAAEEMVDDRYAELGIPMRTLNIANNVTHEITTIKPQRFNAGTFNFPANYPQLTRQEMYAEIISTIPSHQSSEIGMEELDEMQTMIQKQIEEMKQRRQAHPSHDELRLRENERKEEEEEDNKSVK